MSSSTTPKPPSPAKPSGMESISPVESWSPCSLARPHEDLKKLEKIGLRRFSLFYTLWAATCRPISVDFLRVIDTPANLNSASRSADRCQIGGGSISRAGCRCLPAAAMKASIPSSSVLTLASRMPGSSLPDANVLAIPALPSRACAAPMASRSSTSTATPNASCRAKCASNRSTASAC